SIDWGDSSSSAGTITFSAGVFTVAGSHQYAQEGSKNITVTISHDSAPTATANSTASVADAAQGIAATSPSSSPPNASSATGSGSFSDYDDAVTVSQVSGPSGSISQTSGTSGTWTWTQSGALDEGSYTVVVKATGDQDSPTTSFTFTVTDVAP